MINLKLLIFIVLAIINCTFSKPVLGNRNDGADNISLDDQGFRDDNTLAVIGNGVSKEGLKKPLQIEATAKESARIDAMSKVAEMCRGPMPAGCGVWEQSQFTNSAVAKDIAGRFKGTKPSKIRCVPEGEMMSCRALFIIEKKGIKKDCELARSEVFGYSQ